MKKTAIFEDVVSIMTHDSSTIKDRKGCDTTFSLCLRLLTWYKKW